MEISVLKKARIIDCTGADPQDNASVVIEGDRIKEVVGGPVGQLPDDARIIDCQGQNLLPA